MTMVTSLSIFMFVLLSGTANGIAQLYCGGEIIIVVNLSSVRQQ